MCILFIIYNLKCLKKIKLYCHYIFVWLHLCNLFFDTNHFRLDGAWDLIWRLKVPPKIKSFIWLVCSNRLPMRMRF